MHRANVHDLGPSPHRGRQYGYFSVSETLEVSGLDSS